jgi:two-component system NtrC family sensor kinase
LAESLSLDSQIYWVSLNQEVRVQNLVSSLQSSLEGSQSHIVNDIERLHEVQLSDGGSVVCLVGLPDESDWDRWSQFGREMGIPILLIVCDEPIEQVVRFVNSSQLCQMVSVTTNVERTLKSVRYALKQSLEKRKQMEINRQLLAQNKKLQEMTQGLGKIVESRTRHVSDSKSAIENRLTSVRSLMQFVKSMSQVTHAEEVLLLLSKEVGRFNKVKHSFLGFQNQTNDFRIMSIQGYDVVSRRVLQTWPISLRLRNNASEDRQYLANQFGRPFGKVLTVPLTRVKVGRAHERLPAVLFFEHSFDDEGLDKFVDFLQERLQPLGITLDRLLLEMDLKSASLTWERTFDGIKDPVSIFDIDYKVLRCNQAFEKVFLEKVTSHCEDLKEKKVLEKTLESNRFHCQIVHENLFYDLTSYPIRVEPGDMATTVVCHYLDMTENRQLQSKMIQHEKVAAIGHLAGSIAHELNNPLTGIRSLSQILLNQVESDSTLRGDLLEVEKAAARCQLIIKNLLEFSSDEIKSEREKVPLNDIVEKTLPLLKTAMRSFSCHVSLSEKDTSVRIEPQLMQQVVFNLVNNACQAMKERGEIQIQTDVKGGMVELSVSDTGRGIPSDVLPRIFDPFFTTKSEGKGTGLGLSMCASVIKSFGGSIEVDSRIGAGATFTVQLPGDRK